MEYTKEEIEEFKKKADKWDALGKEIENFYFDEQGNERPDEFGDGLLGIGEAAAIAFGWLL